MAKLVVLYKTPKNTDAFDKYYFATHVPLAKKIPGLTKYDVSKGAVASPAGASGVHLVATLYFARSTPSKPPSRPPKGKPPQATSPILRMVARTFISSIRKRSEEPPKRHGPKAGRKAPILGAVRSSRRD